MSFISWLPSTYLFQTSHLRCLTLLRNYYDQIVAENGDMATGFFLRYFPCMKYQEL